ncbi:MAG: hypothetical protein IPN34_24520 [Planctomycetes bacterium]|nr:hypothetical protein [Planctomycetota bacterium]
MNARPPLSLSILSASLGVLCAAPGTLRAQGATLLRDVRTVLDAGGSSDDGEGAVLGGVALFSAADRTHGRELWRSDGTTGGTWLVRDLFPGIGASAPLGTNDRELLLLGNAVYFTADDGGEGRELWRSDGSRSGTALLRALAPGANAGVSSLAGAGTSHFYFGGVDESHGLELWVSDGTESGTTLLADAATGTAGSRLDELTVIGNAAYYNAGDGAGWFWKSDGTPAGTQEVARLRLASNVARLSGILYFAASPESDLGDVELWRSDGTTAGTYRVADLVAGSGASSPSQFVRLGSRIYFTAATSPAGRELWSTQGTAATTQILADVVPGAVGSDPVGLEVLGTRLVFGVTSSAAGSYRGLWSHPGVGGSADKIGEVMPTSPYAGRSLFAPLGASWVFRGTSTSSGDAELYRTDGTTPGTQLVRDIRSGESSAPEGFLALSTTRVLFWATGSDGRRNLWRTDGTSSGTNLVKDFLPPVASSEPSFAEPETAIDAESRTVVVTISGGMHPERALATFAADDGVLGREPWQSDGSAVGTSLLRDLNPGSGSSAPVGFARVRGFTLFGAYEPSAGTELFRTDDTAAGTSLAVDVTPGASGRGAKNFTEHRGRATFIDSQQQRLYLSDGTIAGTATLYSGGSQLRNFRRIGERLWFANYGSDVSNPTRLFLSDGTVAGTQVLVNFGDRRYSPKQFTELAGRVFFVAAHPSYGTELWSSDGTTGGTSIAIDLVPGIAEAFPFDLERLGERIYFFAYTSATGRELWSIGAALDLQLVADILPGPSGSSPTDLTVLGGRLFFTASDGTSGRELWSSDGTPSGTARVIDLAPGIASALPAEGGYLLALPGAERLLFCASDGVSGLELWSSDGTAAGTRLVTDIASGSAASSPGVPALYGNRLYFAADDGVHGREPWVLPSPAAAIPYGAGCAGTGGRIPTLVGTGGAPRLGNAGFAVELRDALASTPAALAISLLPFDFPLGGGCDLLVDPLGGLNSQLGATSASGVARFALPIPAEPLLVGAQAFLQGLALDPQGSLQGLLAFSPGLALILAEG